MSKISRAAVVLASAIICTHFFQAAAHAHESDWLYFPMYERDTAHAVHLSALQFRPDGLLRSATRYPRFPDEPWTQAESKSGWYNYQPRLIDCETGFHVETGMELLDRAGQKIASRVYETDSLVDRLIGQLRDNQSRSWPHQSEIFLACAAASHPTLKAQRAKAARASIPLISYKPVTQDLTAESSALFELTKFRYDISATIKRNPVSAQSVFDHLRRQYIEWRKAIYKPYQASTAKLSQQPQVQSTLSEILQQAGVQPGAVRVIDQSTIEYTGELNVLWRTEAPKNVPTARMRAVTVRIDCESGLSVPISQSWHDKEGKLLLRAPLPVREVIDDVQQRYSAHAEQHVADIFPGAQQGSDAAAICTVFERAKRHSPPSHGSTSKSGDSLMPFGLSAEQLAKEKTPEAMLLRIRAAWRPHRAAQVDASDNKRQPRN